MTQRFTTSQRKHLPQRAKPFVLQKGALYRFGQDNRFRQVLQQLCGGIARGHFFFDIIVLKI
jgi:hypothetical protein